MTDAELNGHLDTLKECADWIDTHAMDHGDPSGRLRDYIMSASVVIRNLDTALSRIIVLTELAGEACTEWHRLADHRHALLRHVEATAESDEILHDAQTQIASIVTDMDRIAAIRLSLEQLK